MTDEQLNTLETIARFATPGSWKTTKYKIYANKKNIASTQEVYSYKEDEEVLPKEAEANATYISAVSPATILNLISQIRTCHELIEVLTEAVIMTESIAFTRSYFNHSAYAEICRNISELRQKAGLPPIGGRND